jgi:Mn-dependent DtxR family transcriptional regulator
VLRRLLQIAARAETVCSASLASELGVSEALVEAMLEDLAQRGYLRPVATGGASACEGCLERAACLRTRQARTWSFEPGQSAREPLGKN